MRRSSLVLATIALSSELLASPVHNTRTLHIPLNKRNILDVETWQRESVDWSRLKDNVNVLTEKYRRQRGVSPSGELSKRGQTAEEPLVDDVVQGVDNEYYGTISVGTPGQNFNIDFDTGSADLWVTDSKCQQNCPSQTFDSSKSSTYSTQNQNFQLQYGTGSVQGTVAYDTVTVAGLTVTKQPFGDCPIVSQEFANNPSDGIMGMAFSNISVIGQKTFFENLISQNALTNNTFAFRLARNATDSGQGAQLTLGGYDSTKFSGPISWAPVVSETYWEVELVNVNYGNQTIRSAAAAAIDTGTTLIVASTADAAALYQAIPGSGQSTQGTEYYTFPCQSPPLVSLQFGDVAYLINPIDFSLGPDQPGSDQCVGAIIGQDVLPGSDLWIVGDTFLKSWYSIYDYDQKRVGFAQSNL